MSNKPNIIMIMTDDHGYWAMGCDGNQEIHTPNLDRLAQNGVLFKNFFCVSPVCSPARASIFTGKIPSQHGIHDWIHKGHASESELNEELRAKIYDEKAPDEYNWVRNQMKGDVAIDYLEGQTCFTEVLAHNGYTCGLSGKWHMGNSGKAQAGFSYWKSIAMGGDNYYYPTVLQNDEFVMLREKYLTEYITENAIDFIEQTKGDEKPFYLSVHYTAPHSPWGKDQHPAEAYQIYEDCPFESVPNEPAHEWSIYKSQTKEQAAKARIENLKGYYAAVTAMDKGVGELLDYLEENNLIEDTLIIFTSDNGMSMGHHGIFGKGNGTFPLNMYDTAVKVPAIISYPKAMKKGEINEELLSHYDIMPTLLEYLELENNIDTSTLPGQSFAPLLEGKGLERDTSVIIFDEYGPTRMIRTKEWKYIHRYPYGPHELYHLVEDPGEKINLIDEEKCSVITKELRGKLSTWFNKYVDPLVDGKGEAVKGYGQTGKGEYK
ncbi:MAG: sulfatase-like hydrolase/transferase [Cellulosilyticaceae bacterium]